MVKYAVTLAALLVASPVMAQTYTLTWSQDPTVDGTETEIERAPATGKACGVYAKIATVPITTLTYVDTSAPNGIVCYRARNIDTLPRTSDYSNVAAAPRTKPPSSLNAN